MWFSKKKIKEFQLPTPLKFKINDMKQDLNKYVIQVIYKNKRIDRFEIFDKCIDNTQYLDLRPKEYTTLSKGYLEYIQSDKVKEEAKRLYSLEFQSKYMQYANPYEYTGLVNNSTITIPIKGDFNHQRIVRTEDIREVLINKSVYETVEYKWAEVINAK